LLTYDDVNQKEWLDLTETTDFTLQELTNALSPGGPFSGFSIATSNEVYALAESAGVAWIPGDQSSLLTSYPQWPEGENAGQLVLKLGPIGSLDADSGSNVVDDLDGNDNGFFIQYIDVNENSLFDEGDVYLGHGFDVDDLHSYTIDIEDLGIFYTGGLALQEPLTAENAAASWDLIAIAGQVDDPEMLNTPVVPANPRGGFLNLDESTLSPVTGPFWLVRNVVPEPTSVALLAIGCIGALCYRNR